mgnify:CR=1 FL=1
MDCISKWKIPKVQGGDTSTLNWQVVGSSGKNDNKMITSRNINKIKILLKI